MKTRLTLKIKRRSQAGWLIWLLVLFPFAFGGLSVFLGVPWMVRYILDFAWIPLLLKMVIANSLGRTAHIKCLSVWFLLFVFNTLLVYLVQFQSPLYYLWGVRNNFRFYIAFFAFVAWLSGQDVDQYLGYYDKLYWINFIVSLIQYYVMGISGDYLGGIFGVEQGCNGYSVIFYAIVLSKAIVSYLEKRETVWLCLTKCVVAIYICALAEIKFFFVVFVVIVGLAVVFTEFTWRKFLLIMAGAVGVSLGAMALAQIFSGDQNWFTLKWMYELASSDKGYTSSGDLNRLNAIPQINELWLTTWGERLFGLGLGNCDTSSFAIVNTPFYEAYGDMHYTWLSYAMMYLECGWIGLIFYFGFFVLVYLNIRKIEKRSTGVARTYCRMGRILAILCIIISVYNSSLRTEAAYMVYFVLAIPFVFNKNRGSKGEENAERIYEKHLAERKGEFR